MAAVSVPTGALLRAQSDERLAALAGAGHERAFEAIVERYRRPLLRACRRVLGEARAEDALQQALMSAWDALRRGDDVRELRPWLFRIARNTALNQLRLHGYEHDELGELARGGPGLDEEAERRMILRATLTGVAALPERQREALLQVAVQGRGQEAVARDLGLSEGAVRALVHRARVHLRAAATALTPMPVATWLASVAPSGAAAGAGGVAASAAKLGAVAVLAVGGVAAGPTIIHVARHDGSSGAATTGRHDRGRDHGEPEPGDDRGGRGELDLAGGRRGSPGGSGRGEGRGRGRSGRDDGGSGDDRSSGGSGDDRSGGGSGDDRSSGGSGDDRSSGGSGDDRSGGGSGDDRSGGGSGDDRSSGGSGDDRSSGGSGPSGGGDVVEVASPSGDGSSGGDDSSGGGGGGSSGDDGGSSGGDGGGSSGGDGGGSGP